MIPLMKNAFLHEYETKQALADFILKAPRLSMDQKCTEFEREFAKMQGSRHGILFNSGGSANLALLQALKNLGRLADGDRVGFSALTWSTNVMPIIQMGLTPVAVDIDPNTLNVMSYTFENQLKKQKIKALFITNALGFAGDLDAIQALCKKKDIILIEDNCESLGTTLPSGKTGTFGTAASFSFFVAHHMSTIEGGMLCTDDDELEEMLRIVRANGWDRNLSFSQQHKWRKRHAIANEFEAKYTFYDLGFNLRPTEITGFLGLFQLQFLKENISAREKNFFALDRIVRENDELISIKTDHLSCVSNFAFPVLCKTPALREKYFSQFSGAGIEIRPMIAGNMQKQPFFKKYCDELSPLPGADIVHDCGFYCGNYPDLTATDLETIASCMVRY